MAEERQQEQKMSPQEEIKELERKLEEKKRALAVEGAPTIPEKEVFREVMREHIGAPQPPPTVTPPISHIPSVLPASPRDAVEDSKRDEQLRMLIERALTRNIANAVAAAAKESPYLLDELHDRLVDEYYDKLIALRKIDPL